MSSNTIIGLGDLKEDVLGVISKYLTWKEGRALNGTNRQLRREMKRHIHLRLRAVISYMYFANYKSFSKEYVESRVVDPSRQLDGYYVQIGEKKPGVPLDYYLRPNTFVVSPDVNDVYWMGRDHPYFTEGGQKKWYNVYLRESN